MRPLRSRLHPLKIGLGVCTISLAMACDAPGPAPKGGSDPVIGTIGDAPVSQGELVQAFIAEQGPAFFNRYAEKQLVERAASEAGISVTDAECNAAADREVQSILKGRFGGDEARLRSHLAEQGWAYDVWLEGRRRDQRTQLLTRKIMAKQIPEKDIEALYTRRYGAGGTTLKVAQILVTTHIQSSTLYTEAQHKAEQASIKREARLAAKKLRKRLIDGADFAALAKAHSDDFTAPRGGWAGDDWNGRYGQAFENLVGRLAVGEISPVLEGEQGFHVVQVEGVRKGARYTGSYIFIAEQAGERDQTQALALAEEIVRRLAEGGDFATEAKSYSNDMRTRAQGGDLGTFGPGRLGPETDAVLETLTVGSVSGPIRVDGGYQIVKLDSRTFLPSADRRLVRHIMVGTSYLRVKSRRLKGKIAEQAKQKAMGYMKRLAEGDITFEALAKTASEDRNTRGQGGAIPQWRPGLLGPEVDANLKEMKAGQIRLVQSRRGFHLVKLVDRTTVPLAEVRGELEKELAHRPVSEAETRRFLADLRQKAGVKWTGVQGGDAQAPSKGSLSEAGESETP
ncbi:MAG: peptidylprolyl isomerase [Bradymonadia bacterium]